MEGLAARVAAEDVQIGLPQVQAVPPRPRRTSVAMGYQPSPEDLQLARAHGVFSTGWRERLAPDEQALCPCGCGLRGGVPAHWWRAESRQLLRDGAAFAVYFELLRSVTWRCFMVGLVMLPFWLQRLLALRRSDAPELSLSVLLGSASLGDCRDKPGGDSCLLLEASAALNASILWLVLVALPRTRLALRRHLDEAHVPRAAGLAASGREPSRAVLLHNLPGDAREDDVARFLACELQRMGVQPPDDEEVPAPSAPPPAAPPQGAAAAAGPACGPEAAAAAADAGAGAQPSSGAARVLLAPRDPRLAQGLERYRECEREVQELLAAGPMLVDAELERTRGRSRRELDDLAAALQRPRREFGERGWWDLAPAPVGLAVLRTPREALLLAKALAPATVAKCLWQCCCPKWAPDAALYAWMRKVRVVYPAPEPADVLWDNFSHVKEDICCKRMSLAVLVLLYMLVVFVLLSGIRRGLQGGLPASLLTALGTLLLQETVRKLIWRIDRPLASTHYHATVAVVTMAGCFTSGALVPLFVISIADQSSSKDAWYRSNGMVDFAAHALLTNATLAVIMDALIDTMLPWFFTHVLRRPGTCCGRLLSMCLPAIPSFRALCEVHEGPGFYLGPNIGYSSFTIVFACCCAPVLPAAPFLVAAGLCFWQVKEKWLVLALCRRPRLMSPYVALRGPDLLSYGLAMVPLLASFALLPLCPPSYCTRTSWLTGECQASMQTDHAILTMGFEASVWANAAVHGAYLGREVLQRFACCACGRAGGRQRSRLRRCWRCLQRIGNDSARVIIWLTASLFLWLAAYWRGGRAVGEEITLPFATIILFSDSFRQTLLTIYRIAVYSLVCIGILGIACRLLAGPSTVRARLREDVTFDPLGPGIGHHDHGGGGGDAAQLFEEYARASPFHAVQMLPTGGPATAGDPPPAPTLAGLGEWLRSPEYRAPVVATRA